MTDPAQLADLAINQPDVALIFEGGGMRNSYTAPMVVELLARNLNFGCVYGISAGSSHTVNYLVRDATRARASFVELVKYPRFGGWGSFVRGTGYFNSPYRPPCPFSCRPPPSTDAPTWTAAWEIAGASC